MESIINIFNKIEGDFVVETNTNLYGMIVGSVTVKKGVTFILYGMVIGDLINYGETIVYGTINGQIVNNKGQLQIDKNAKINEIKNDNPKK